MLLGFREFYVPKIPPSMLLELVFRGWESNISSSFEVDRRGPDTASCLTDNYT
jgi:hypothetical protein